MKRTLTFLIAVLVPLQFLSAGLQKSIYMSPSNPSLSIPDQFLTSSHTKSAEWGCPVNDIVKAGSKAAAVKEIENECQREILKAVQNTPNTKSVISIKTIWPDLQIRENAGEYHMTGTIFFETLAMH